MLLLPISPLSTECTVLTLVLSYSLHDVLKFVGPKYSSVSDSTPVVVLLCRFGKYSLGGGTRSVEDDPKWKL